MKKDERMITNCLMCQKEMKDHPSLLCYECWLVVKTEKVEYSRWDTVYTTVVCIGALAALAMVLYAMARKLFVF